MHFCGNMTEEARSFREASICNQQTIWEQIRRELFDQLLFRSIQVGQVEREVVWYATGDMKISQCLVRSYGLAQLQTMSKSENFGEERAKVLGKFMFLMDSTNSQASSRSLSTIRLADTRTRLETIECLASGPTKIKQPLYRTHDMMDE
uniref:Uncharacterized protein n=1 Tax=Ditylenchus dipsaci TaxID=166011 RepID=A0A915E5R0_9BILA